MWDEYFTEVWGSLIGMWPLSTPEFSRPTHPDLVEHHLISSKTDVGRCSLIERHCCIAFTLRGFYPEHCAIDLRVDQLYEHTREIQDEHM